MEPENNLPQTAIDLAAASGTPTAVTSATSDPTITTPFVQAKIGTTPGEGQLKLDVTLTGGLFRATYDFPGDDPFKNIRNFGSSVLFRIGNSGRRDRVEEIATNPLSVERNSTSATSRFNVRGLQFDLIQSIGDLNQGDRRVGAGLSQVYRITNLSNETITFELVRYVDGDLGDPFANGGGWSTQNGKDILITTDSRNNDPAVTPSFVAFTANGGEQLTSNRYEIREASNLSNRLVAGVASLTNGIEGDTNGDSLIDTNNFNLASALRNVFTLAPGGSTDYTTETFLGTGVPTEVLSLDAVAVVPVNIPTNNNPTITTPFVTSTLTTAAGDGQLSVNLDLTGSFSGADYDPLGAKNTADTTFESDVAFRVGDTGVRQFLGDIATNKSSVERNNNSTTSRFDAGGLRFELVQSVIDSTQGGSRTGSSLSQVYQITNPTDREITFEFVRYFDGDLGFDGSIADSGGRIVRNGRDILFETDSGDNPAAPTTFVGITANGGTRLADNRYEIGQYSSLRSRILDGQALSNGIQGDTNRDLFIDTAPYDVTPAFRNVFTLAAGESTSYITETLFGTGVPTQIILPETITVAATDYTAIEDTKDPAVFTLTRTNGNLTKSLTVSYTLSGKAISGEDYTPITNTVTFAAGETTATVSIDPLTDGKLEGSESVILTLESNPGYNLSDRGRQSRIAIADDASTIVDRPPTISIDNITRKEGNSGTTPATFNITLNKVSEVEVTVDYATKEGTAKAGEDFFAAAKNTIVFAPGEVSKEVTIDITGDRVDEPDETFQVVLSEPTNATLSSESTATATIINDDPLVSLSVSDGEAAETKSGEAVNPGQFVLRRRGDLSKPLTVKYALSGTSNNEDDYRQLTDTTTFEAGLDRLEVNIDPFDDRIFESTESTTLTLLDDPNYIVDGTASNGSIAIADNGDSASSRLTRSATNLLEIDGGTNNTILKFTKLSAQSRDANEIAAFTVDDDLGSINGIKPGESGYLAAALDRAQVIFSVLGNSGFNNDAERSSERYLNIPPGKRIEFLNIAKDTLETVRADFAAGKEITNVSFSVAAANGGSGDRTRLAAANSDSSAYEIGWETDNNANKDFKDLVLKVEAIESLTRPVGTTLQGRQDNQVVDLRGFGNRQVFIGTATVGDASYRNNVGFYEVEDAQGTLANGLKPGDVGYAEAAVSGAILRDRSNRQVDASLPFTGGKILAPVVIANGTFGEFLDRNPQNNVDPNKLQAYFNFKGANPDKIDHFRLLGDNKFAVEDMIGGGDRDFNDIIFQLNVRTF